MIISGEAAQKLIKARVFRKNVVVEELLLDGIRNMNNKEMA